MRRILVSLLITFCALTCVDVRTTHAKPAPVEVIELTPHPSGTDMLTVRAKVRGREGVFLFDTGGGVSYISPAFAGEIGCKPWGQISGFVLTGQRLDMKRCDGLAFDIGGRSFAAPTFGVFDIMKFMPPGLPKVDGSIGLDVFANQAVTLSIARRQLTVESGGSLKERAKRGREVPIRLVRECEGLALAVVVAVPTPEGVAWMEIDSGNGGANVIGKHIAPLLKLDAAKKEPQPASFEIEGGVPVGGMARVNETLIMDGNIGTRFLKDWDLTLDLSKGRAWLSPSNK